MSGYLLHPRPLRTERTAALRLRKHFRYLPQAGKQPGAERFLKRDGPEVRIRERGCRAGLEVTGGAHMKESPARGKAPAIGVLVAREIR